MTDHASLISPQVNLFPKSFQSTPAQTVSLSQALQRIRQRMYQSQIIAVRVVLARDGKVVYDKAKAQLPGLTFGGTFAPSRGNAHAQQHSGIVHGDLDHLTDVETVKQAICGDPRTVYAFVSPSGNGLKIGVRVAPVADDATYKYVWQVVSTCRQGPASLMAIGRVGQVNVAEQQVHVHHRNGTPSQTPPAHP